MLIAFISVSFFLQKSHGLLIILPAMSAKFNFIFLIIKKINNIMNNLLYFEN